MVLPPLQVTVKQLDVKMASGLTTAAIEGLAATAHAADDPVRNSGFLYVTATSNAQFAVRVLMNAARRSGGHL